MAPVMVVEDNNTIRMMYAAGLEGLGVPTLEARNLNEAMRYFEDGQIPRVVLLDLRLPGTPGQELIRYIRQNLPDNRITIIVASAYELMRDEVLALGADMFVSKPVDLPDLLHQVQSYSMH